MAKISFIIVIAATLLAVSHAAPFTPRISASESLSTAGKRLYKQFDGDGSVAAGWPDISDWVDFHTMFQMNEIQMRTSCEQYNTTNNSQQEIKDIRHAIDSVANNTDIDKRFVLAVIMQESKGCVRVPTTSLTVTNPGLMQDHGGNATCNVDGEPQVPCPTAQVRPA